MFSWAESFSRLRGFFISHLKRGYCFKVPFYNMFLQELKYQNLKVVAVWKLSSSTDLPAGITLYL